MSKKMTTVSIGQYLVAKNGTTKYLKLEAKPNADEATKKKVAALKEILGGDVIFVNLYDPQFKEKYNIAEFVKGRIEVEVKDSGKSSDDGVNF